MKPEHLFVYGTLLQALGHPMQRLLARHAVLLARARMPGRLLDLGHYPGLVCTQQGGPGGSMVLGEVWRLQGHGTPLLLRLDIYEGCDAFSPYPREYRRKRAMAWVEGGGRLSVWVYEYAMPVRGRKLVAYGDYVRHAAIRKQRPKHSAH